MCLDECNMAIFSSDFELVLPEIMKYYDASDLSFSVSFLR